VCVRHASPVQLAVNAIGTPKGNVMILVKLLFCLLFPPIAALLQVGISTHFWISVVATLLGGLPGVLHAFWLVLTNQKAS